MFKNYLAIAWRNLVKDRRFALLNLVGLSTGLACALLIYIWVNDELQMDRFHKKEATLYQVLENRVQASGIWTAQSSPVAMGDALVKQIPEVERAVVTDWIGGATLSVNNEKNVKADGKYAGKDFFNMFSYDLIQGNAGQVLQEKKSIVLSDQLAEKLFGTTSNIIGKTVEMQHEEQFMVTGVFKSPGVHSSDRFDFVLPAMAYQRIADNLDNWRSTCPSTYVTLKPGTDPVKLNAKLADFIKRNTNNEVTHRTPFLQQYSTRYLYGRYENGVQVGGRIEYVRLFSLIAIFILVIACINFMNLSTAKASGRAKEVGVKKAMGAGRGSLVLQFLGESVLMAFLALSLAIVLVMFALPAFNNITSKQLALSHLGPGFIVSVLIITLLTGLLAGSYPALYLSGFKPALVLKGKLRGTVGELVVRKGLVVFQFSLSIVLIIAVLVIYRQISFIQNKNLGYDTDHIITFTKEGKLDNAKAQDAFLAEMKNIPGVINASSIAHSLTGHSSGTSGVIWEGKDVKDKTEFEVVPVDYDLLQTLDIKIKEGRGFSRDFGTDTSMIIFNEAAIKFMGMRQPIGKEVELWDSKMHIGGVVKDFHFQSLHDKVKPLFFILDKSAAYKFVVKLEADKEKTAIARLGQLYQQFNPGFSFDYRFLDSNYDKMYTAEKQVSLLSRYFAGLAILISCLGLFGLAAFTAQRRLKEIGIRKVLGATEGTIVVMLSKDFLKLVGIAILIAFPVAWWASSQWLKGFAYSIHIGPGIFIAAAILIVLITLATISFQSVKAALTNPVKSLRTE
ncbi:MAG: ABC transporter permease [Chitinophaga sp.]|uniref:ABC transporter permease n=1 Tax=Chitinophaga sp. TaxID=1869181 RepID=UPI001B1760B8|nr:ABC transporter permease [Chitinophaga sp.]MBO9732335.1 ABC transporter permease [Chitinophaga sp.]